MTLPALKEFEAQLVPRALPEFTDMSDAWDLAEQEIPQVFKQAMPRGELAVIGSEPGMGKTHLAIGLGLSVVFNKAMARGFTPSRAGRVALLLGEDSKHPIAQRARAWCERHGIPRAEFEAALADGRLSFLCGDSAELLSYGRDGGERTPAHAELLALAEAEQWDLLIVDSLIQWAGVPNENDNAMMQTAGMALIALARASGGAVLALCHTNKQGNRTGEANLSAIRGGGALAGKFRWGGLLLPFNDADLKHFGIPKAHRKRYLRFEVIKEQYTGGTGEGTIFERGPGGVLEAVDLQPTGEANLLQAIRDELTARPQSFTAREMYKSTGVASVEFRAAVSKRANNANAGWRAMQEAINAGLFSGELVEAPHPDNPNRVVIDVA